MLLSEYQLLDTFFRDLRSGTFPLTIEKLHRNQERDEHALKSWMWMQGKWGDLTSYGQEAVIHLRIRIAERDVIFQWWQEAA